MTGGPSQRSRRNETASDALSCRCARGSPSEGGSDSDLPTHHIELRGVRVHNLQGVDLLIPHGQWISVCGRSGSGKSSLAFDTLYAEGQRRYVETFSPYARQFLPRFEEPRADYVAGIPPSIGIQGEFQAAKQRATVGSSAQLLDYLRLLYAQLAVPVCDQCGLKARPEAPDSVVDWIGSLQENKRLQIGFRLDSKRETHTEWTAGGASDKANPLGRHPAKFSEMAQAGFTRVVLDHQTRRLDEWQQHGPIDHSSRGSEESAEPAAGGRETRGYGSEDATSQPAEPSVSGGMHEPIVLVDRLKTGSSSPSRLTESLETGFKFGQGELIILIQCDGLEKDKGDEQTTPVDESFADWRYFEIDGAWWQLYVVRQSAQCPRCGQIFPEAEPALFNFDHVSGACSACDGTGTIERESANSSGACDTCLGTRLNRSARQFQIDKCSLPDVCGLSVDDMSSWLNETIAPKVSAELEHAVVEPVQQRLGYLQAVGLGYLGIDRSSDSLSQGEWQRVRLAQALGTTLVNLLYVLDEPSTGLHAHECDQLVGVLRDLNSRGNTVVVVDHEPALMMASQRIIELGPGQGAAGGQITFDGTPQELRGASNSETGRFLRGDRSVPSADNRRVHHRGYLRLIGARGHNLQSVDVQFPHGVLCAVSGVSGSGKSSLVRQTLYPAIVGENSAGNVQALPYDRLLGAGGIGEAILVDQSLPAKTWRSNAATFVKAFDEIRQLFGGAAEAKRLNLTPGSFSFNVSGGRCEKCRGEGVLRVDMQFLPEVSVVCDHCRGRRFNDQVLSVKYRGRSIAEVLDLTVQDAFTFFRGQPKIQGRLKSLIDVGLDYLALGQPLSTLSTGERQRLKLAQYITRAAHQRCLLILDEPTCGLHMADVTRLLDCFDILLSVGHSLIVIEHNLQLLQYADYLIDLGPGGGEQGGRLLVNGTPEEVMECPESLTGKYLKEFIQNSELPNE